MESDSLINSDIEAIIDSVISSSEEKIENIINKDKENNLVCISNNNNCINRVNEKCVNCGRCKKVCDSEAAISYDLNIVKEPICIGCGKCLVKCPVGAITPKYTYRYVKEIIDKNENIVIGIVNPSVSVSIGEAYGMSNENHDGKLVTALKKLGFDYVFNSSFGTDLCVLEDVSSFVDRINKQLSLPQISSFCPSFIRYAEIYHPEILDNISTVKSPSSICASIIKNYFSNIKGIDSKKIVVVMISPCTALKMEIKEYTGEIDYVINTSELSLLLKEEDIDFKNLNNSDYDKDFECNSGSTVLTTISGGYNTALIRTLYKMYTGKKIPSDMLTISNLDGNDGIKLASINIENKIINVACVNGINNLNELLSSSYYKKLHLVEVFSCDGGCINGSGEILYDLNKKDEVLLNRKNSIIKKDKSCKIRCSYENDDVKKIYKEYIGNPLDEKANSLFHMNYSDKSYMIRKQD